MSDSLWPHGLCSPPGSSIHGILQARILCGQPFSSPGDLPDPGIEPGSPALKADSLLSEPPGKSIHILKGPSVGGMLFLTCIYCRSRNGLTDEERTVSTDRVEEFKWFSRCYLYLEDLNLVVPWRPGRHSLVLPQSFLSQWHMFEGSGFGLKEHKPVSHEYLGICPAPWQCGGVTFVSLLSSWFEMLRALELEVGRGRVNPGIAAAEYTA